MRKPRKYKTPLPKDNPRRVVKLVHGNLGSILRVCDSCGRLNYAERSRSATVCMCVKGLATHSPIPAKYLEHSGLIYIGPRKLRRRK